MRNEKAIKIIREAIELCEKIETSLKLVDEKILLSRGGK